MSRVTGSGYRKGGAGAGVAGRGCRKREGVAGRGCRKGLNLI